MSFLLIDFCSFTNLTAFKSQNPKQYFGSTGNTLYNPDGIFFYIHRKESGQADGKKTKRKNSFYKASITGTRKRVQQK